MSIVLCFYRYHYYVMDPYESHIFWEQNLVKIKTNIFLTTNRIEHHVIERAIRAKLQIC